MGALLALLLFAAVAKDPGPPKPPKAEELSYIEVPAMMAEDLTEWRVYSVLAWLPGDDIPTIVRGQSAVFGKRIGKGQIVKLRHYVSLCYDQYSEYMAYSHDPWWLILLPDD